MNRATNLTSCTRSSASTGATATSSPARPFRRRFYARQCIHSRFRVAARYSPRSDFEDPSSSDAYLRPRPVGLHRSHCPSDRQPVVHFGRPRTPTHLARPPSYGETPTPRQGPSRQRPVTGPDSTPRPPFPQCTLVGSWE